MNRLFPFLLAALLMQSSSSRHVPAGHPASIHPVLDQYLQERLGEFDQISDERCVELSSLATKIGELTASDQPVQLNFICTHNSRRSHLAQIWTSVAAHYFGLTDIHAFSGGTEATAMNERIVATLRRAGLKIDVEKILSPSNPHYSVQFAHDGTTLDCFSKVYNEAPNPSDGFLAVLVCGNADKNCPVVQGATDRLVIRYDDPKASDDTPQESQTYDERCAQISREMLYAISQLK